MYSHAQQRCPHTVNLGKLGLHAIRHNAQDLVMVNELPAADHLELDEVVIPLTFQQVELESMQGVSV